MVLFGCLGAVSISNDRRVSHNDVLWQGNWSRSTGLQMLACCCWKLDTLCCDSRNLCLENTNGVIFVSLKARHFKHAKVRKTKLYRKFGNYCNTALSFNLHTVAVAVSSLGLSLSLSLSICLYLSVCLSASPPPPQAPLTYLFQRAEVTAPGPFWSLYITHTRTHARTHASVLN